MKVSDLVGFQYYFAFCETTKFNFFKKNLYKNSSSCSMSLVQNFFLLIVAALSITAIIMSSMALNGQLTLPSNVVLTDKVQTVSNKLLTSSTADTFVINGYASSLSPNNFIVKDGFDDTILDVDGRFGTRLTHLSALPGLTPPSIITAVNCTAQFEPNPTDLTGMIKITPTVSSFTITIEYGTHFINAPLSILLTPGISYSTTAFSDLAATSISEFGFSISGTSTTTSVQYLYYLVIGNNG